MKVKNRIWSFLAWYKLKSIFHHFNYLSYLHRLAIKKEKAKILNEFFTNKLVVDGPFKGLKYPLLKSNGSPVLPKLIGSYEAELHSEIYRALETDYSEIIDIGCAEGYYAVGFALKKPSVNVLAFDTNVEAQSLCREMAIANGVESKVSIEGFCNAEAILNIRVRKKGLIISDCEGYETTLFSKDLITSLSDFDFLIETHDCYDPNNSKELKNRFTDTHIVRSVFSIGDTEKMKKYKFHIKNNIPKEFLFNLYSEGRIGITEWIICKSKN